VLEGYRFEREVEVRFADMDAIGHVNNATYLTYLESARIAYWLEVTGRTGIESLDMILARTEIDYRSAARFGETLLVGARVASLRRSSFVMEFKVVERESARLVAEARKVLVHYDYAAGRTTPLPATLRERILARDPDAVQE
jgi:acyl-CoA thioester hydrolase